MNRSHSVKSQPVHTTELRAEIKRYSNNLSKKQLQRIKSEEDEWVKIMRSHWDRQLQVEREQREHVEKQKRMLKVFLERQV
jgi:hypothetical protein